MYQLFLYTILCVYWVSSHKHYSKCLGKNFGYNSQKHIWNDKGRTRRFFCLISDTHGAEFGRVYALQWASRATIQVQLRTTVGRDTESRKAIKIKVSIISFAKVIWWGQRSITHTYPSKLLSHTKLFSPFIPQIGFTPSQEFPFKPQLYKSLKVFST